MSDPFGPNNPQQRPPQPQQPQGPRPPQQQGYGQQQAPPPQQPSRREFDDLSEPFMYEPADDDVMRRRRQMAIGALLTLVVLAGAFFFISKRDTKSSTDKAADLVAAGLTAYTQGDYASARKNFQDAIAKDDQNPFAHYNLGLIEQVVDNNPAGAEAEYRKAIALKPDFASPLFNLGIIRANAGAKDEAIDLYRRAIAADDQFASPHLNLGFLLLEKDPDSIEAQTEFQKAVILDPTMASRIPASTTSTTTKRSATTTTAKKR
jgi:Tfp pilus assembly protein PilF